MMWKASDIAICERAASRSFMIVDSMTEKTEEGKLVD
jgi:hypothetical protein